MLKRIGDKKIEEYQLNQIEINLNPNNTYNSFIYNNDNINNINNNNNNINLNNNDSNNNNNNNNANSEYNKMINKEKSPKARSEHCLALDEENSYIYLVEMIQIQI